MALEQKTTELPSPATLTETNKKRIWRTLRTRVLTLRNLKIGWALLISAAVLITTYVVAVQQSPSGSDYIWHSSRSENDPVVLSARYTIQHTRPTDWILPQFAPTAIKRIPNPQIENDGLELPVTVGVEPTASLVNENLDVVTPLFAPTLRRKDISSEEVVQPSMTSQSDSEPSWDFLEYAVTVAKKKISQETATDTTNLEQVAPTTLVTTVTNTASVNGALSRPMSTNIPLRMNILPTMIPRQLANSVDLKSVAAPKSLLQHTDHWGFPTNIPMLSDVQPLRQFTYSQPVHLPASLIPRPSGYQPTKRSDQVSPTMLGSTLAPTPPKYETIVSAASGSGSDLRIGNLSNFDPGLGSCGIASRRDEQIVAVSHLVMDAAKNKVNFTKLTTDPLCGSVIRAFRTGADGQQRSVDLKIVDRCK
jgi:hypothetical protein